MISALDSLKRATSRVLGRPEPALPTGGPSQSPVGNTPEVTSGELDPGEERELRVERDRLIEKFAVMQSDLGGAFYEMAIRDHVRMDVLTRKAAELQQVDAELLAIERMLEIQSAGSAGICPTCGSPFGQGVLFCSRCGNPLQSPMT